MYEYYLLICIIIILFLREQLKSLSLKHRYIHLLYGNDFKCESRRVLRNKRVLFDVGALILKLATLVWCAKHEDGYLSEVELSIQKRS